MTAIVGLLALLSVWPQSGIASALFRQCGSALLQQERYADAERVFRGWEEAVPGDVEALYHRALAVALQGRTLEARAGFSEVIARDPTKADAYFETAATFLQTLEYDQMLRWAVRGLRISPHNDYGLDLAGTAAYLAGGRIQALRYWNQLGRPTLTTTDITAVGVSRQTVADEIDLKPGDLLSWRAVERARWRLGQHEYLTATFNPVPGATPREYSLEVSANARRGLGSPWEVLFTSLSELGFRSLRLNYWNIGGSGVTLSGRWRWTDSAERLTVDMSVPRFMHLPVYSVVSYAARDESWDFGPDVAGLRLRTSKVGVRTTIPLRAPELTMTVGLVAVQRGTALLNPSAEPVSADLEDLRADVSTQGTVWLHTTSRATWPARQWGSWNLRRGLRVGADGGWAKGSRDARYSRVSVSVESRLERTRSGWRQEAISVGGHAAAVSRPALLEDHFVLGAGPDADYQLRAHPFMRGGRPGAAPMGAAFFSANVTATRDIVRWSWFKLGVLAFLDAADVMRAHPAQRSGGRYLDGGLGAEFGSSVMSSRRICLTWGRDFRTGGNIVFLSAPLR